MFSQTELKSGGKLQEVKRSGKHAEYDYTPEGQRKPTHRVRARSAQSAEGKLLETGILSYEDYRESHVDDVKPLTADAKKPVDPYAKLK